LKQAPLSAPAVCTALVALLRGARLAIEAPRSFAAVSWSVGAQGYVADDPGLRASAARQIRSCGRLALTREYGPHSSPLRRRCWAEIPLEPPLKRPSSNWAGRHVTDWGCSATIGGRFLCADRCAHEVLHRARDFSIHKCHRHKDQHGRTKIVGQHYEKPLREQPHLNRVWHRYRLVAR